MTFFSGTDTDTLLEEGKDRNHFVSLIVNNAGTYTAAITKHIDIEASIHENYAYKTFGNTEIKGEFAPRTYKHDEIRWHYLTITKEEDPNSFQSDLDMRLEEIKTAKDNIAKAAVKTDATIYRAENYPSFDFSSYAEGKSYRDNSDKVIESPKESAKEPIRDSIEEPELPFEDTDINPKDIMAAVKQLVTGSIILPNDSKIKIKEWARHMVPLYERRFGKGEKGMRSFRNWAESYIDFLVWDFSDKYPILTDFEIGASVSNKMISLLKTLPKNDYINGYIAMLENYGY